MAVLVWNEGMSVGDDIIDADHKKIIAILAKLTSVQSSKISKEIIETIFAELEDYVAQHFAREEALLARVGYADLKAHRKSHRAFIKKIPQLKHQWLSEDNLVTCEKITMFLHHWIVNHILVEDLDYVPTLYKQSKKNKQAIAKASAAENKISHWLACTARNLMSLRQSTVFYFSSKVKLSKRVFITAFIPVLAIFLLCSTILFDNYQRYNKMKLVLGLNNIIEQVNDITHSLQAERGLSSGFTSSNYQHFAQQLTQRRLLTDNAITTFRAVLGSKLAPEVRENIQPFLDDSKTYLIQLQEYRRLIDKQAIGFEGAFEGYSQLIAKSLSILEQLSHIEINAQLSSDISAIHSLLLFKEYMGQIRALGMNKVTGESDDIYQYKAITLLVGQQLNALRVFHYSAGEQQKVICATYCDASVYAQLLANNFTRIIEQYPVDNRAGIWFDFMSGEIDQLKRVSDELNQTFNNKTLAAIKTIEQYNVVLLVLLSLVLFISVLFSLILNDSIINPVRKITHALNRMAKGQRDIHFKEQVANDEIGAMQVAYEKLRRKLLQADMFQAIVNRQKNEIEYRKLQQAHFEHLASTDALTGAVNRHQFNQLLADEIAKANSFNQALSILLLDIDHFKRVNDTFGHGVGDEVLVKFYKACKDAARANDIVARIGGEEFVIILPQSNANSAFHFAERLRENIQKLEIVIANNLIALTVSIGVSQWNKQVFSSAVEFIADADKLLYEAKALGRNQVVVS